MVTLSCNNCCGQSSRSEAWKVQGPGFRVVRDLLDKDIPRTPELEFLLDF